MTPVFDRLKPLALHRPRKGRTPDQPFNIADLTFDNATTTRLVRGKYLIQPQVRSKVIG